MSPYPFSSEKSYRATGLIASKGLDRWPYRLPERRVNVACGSGRNLDVIPSSAPRVAELISFPKQRSPRSESGRVTSSDSIVRCRASAFLFGHQMEARFLAI
ncbi:hypothetical protein TNCV_4637661 [Trichonephila clavipes]|nr:hypothetical protein TNCV_4637661 [Trichonephila clavipes]